MVHTICCCIMISRLFVVLFLSVCSLSSFSQSFVKNDIAYRIDGEFSGDYSGFIYLSYGDKMDSTRVKDRKFVFEGSVSFPMQAIFHLNNGALITEGSFFLENSKMTVLLSVSVGADKTKQVAIRSISGNKTAMIMSDLQRFLQLNQAAPDFLDRLYAKLDKMFTDNPKNQLCGMLLSDVATDNLFTYEQLNALYSKLDKKTQSKEAMQFLSLSMNKAKTFRIGAAFKNLGFPDAQGNMIYTNQFRGSVLLVEFWGSWCGPCRQNNPYLVEIYKRYKPLGFEIMGVGLEDDKTFWLQAIKSDGLIWPHTIALGRFNNPAVQAAGIWAVPNNYLVDKDGKLIAINIQPSELIETLEKLLKR